MSLITIFLTALLAASPAGLQENRIKAGHSIENVSQDTVRLLFDLSISKGWHVYSTGLPDGGPTPAAIRFDSISGARPAGSLYFDGKETAAYDATFDIEVRYFENRVRFIQDMLVTDPDYHIEGALEYGACNDESCLPPQHVDFKHDGKASATAAPTAATGIEAVEGYDASTWAPVTYSDKGSVVAGRGLAGLFLTGFLGGLLALLTPCVWPIIPMTVSFFLKRSQKRGRAVKDAVLYGISIITVYVALGLAITLLFGASALNSLATNATVNILFFLILVLFALSFFGLFEITLPSGWSTGTDSKAGKAGFGGIFFMALTLTIVSFSCTGPIVGTVLIKSTSGEFWAPIVTMFCFALAFSLPFVAFALFPNVLKKLPKSGGWLNMVKVVLGFCELALAFKFLSVADLAYGWGILDRETFLCLWIVIFAFLGMYLLGFIRLPHDDDPKPSDRVSVTRLTLALVSFAFALYMVPGLWGAPCKAISAFAPPMSTQDFNLDPDARIQTYHDYEEGMAAAARTGKPVLVDFSGYGCVNCRKMEAAVWTDSQVKSIIDNEYILIELMVDDKTSLSNGTEVVSENGKEVKLRTIGDKWSYLQRSKFGANAQPFYVLLDAHGQPLAGSYSYNEDIDSYVKFLQSGLNH